MPIGAATSSHSGPWVPREKDIKGYLHFDRRLDVTDIAAIANDPVAVATNSFYPLLRFKEEWTKFRQGSIRKTKIRPLRYSSRRDAAIYARYRAILSELYEKRLAALGILDVPTAYRRIPSANRSGNKCNIDFAKDIFEFIYDTGDCVVTVVDIKSYFECLDHERIKKCWESLLGCPMPPDHLAIFKSLTKYAYVERDALFERLGLYEKGQGQNREARRSRKIDKLRASGHVQLCSPTEFRQMVCGGDTKYPSLLQKHTKVFGIPQGTPISDLIANFYLIDFDVYFDNYCKSRGGIYRRYSDDMICVLPKISVTRSDEIKDLLQSEIMNFGPQMEIQDRKVSISEFSSANGPLTFSHVFGANRRNGLEYLGFEFNGRVVKIKNATLSNAWRKLKLFAYGHARRFVRRYRENGHVWLRTNYPFADIEMRMLRDVTFNQDNGYETWTFVKYAKRASRSFLGMDRIFAKQTKRYRYKARQVINESFEKALVIHGQPR